ncbi:MAG: OmpA family protein [Syntrophales bacterium]|nr:OmpA family protein [Syntrophales bacterium]HPL63775.1 OmpA family protein [Syntrophales bacterium]
MLKRIALITIVVFLVSGCLVAKSTYLQKSEEAATCEQQNQKLKNDLAELSRKIAGQKEKIVALEKSKEEIKEESKTYSEMVEKMKSEVEKGQVTITELKGKLTLNMVDSILFDSGKAEVKEGGLAVLTKVVEVLKGAKDKSIRIEGHTDNVRIKGALAQRYPTNWELSAARAINVARYLQQEGIDPMILSAVAYGEFKPIAKNDSSEGRAKNRRIEIILVPKE